jgi:Outer membrane protein beta-barrel domain
LVPPETELFMIKRLWLHGVRYSLGLAAAAAILAPAAAHAQIRQVSSDHRQAVGFTLGGFFPKGEDSRVDDDVLFNDLDDLAFDIGDFKGVSVSGEWLFSLGDFLEAGVGAGFYQNTVHSVYRGFVNANDSEIEQDLKLRIVPVTATVRFLPIGRGSVEPYVGAGIGAFNWRYSEVGEFVAPDSSIFRSKYEANGTAVGPVILAGIRAPIGDVWDIGGEIQYQHASGDTNSAESGLVGDKIDLGGIHALVTMHIRF